MPPVCEILISGTKSGSSDGTSNDGIPETKYGLKPIIDFLMQPPSLGSVKLHILMNEAESIFDENIFLDL